MLTGVFDYSAWFLPAITQVQNAVSLIVPVVLVLCGMILGIDLLWRLIKRFSSGD